MFTGLQMQQCLATHISDQVLPVCDISEPATFCYMVAGCGNNTPIRPAVAYWMQELRRDIAIFDAGVEEMLLVALQSIVVDVLDFLVGQFYKGHFVFVLVWVFNAV